MRLNPRPSQCTLGVLYILLILGESGPNLFTCLSSVFVE